MARLMRENQASTTINELIYAMRLARNEAVTRKLPVAICAGDGNQCTGDNGWGQGWLVFTDPNENGDCVDDGDRNCTGGGRILHRVRDLASGFDLSANGNPGGGGVVVYRASGFAMGYASTFTLCHEDGAIDPRGFTLNMSGRIDPQEPEELSCS
jgi:type IV fimbrial biogenesis protein FimT